MSSVHLSWQYIQSIFQWGMGPRMMLLIILSVLGALTEGIGIGMLIPVLENLQQNNITEMSGISAILAGLFNQIGLPFTLPILLGTMVALLIGQVVLTYIRTVLTTRTYDQLICLIRIRLFQNLLNFDLAYFHKSRIGDLTNALTIESQRAGASFSHLILMLATLALIIFYMVVQFSISWQLSLVTFPILGLLAVLLRPRESYKLGADFTHENERLQSLAVETLGGIREIKALGMEALTLTNFRHTAEQLVFIDVNLIRYGARFTMIYQAVVLFTIATIVIFANQVIQLELAPLLTFLLILQRFAPRVSQLTEYRHWWLGYSHSLYRVEQLIEETDQSVASLVDGSVTFTEFKQAVTLHDVHFKYDSQTEPALRGMSLTIPCGQMTAIVGSSGAGKSTLLDLIIRFYDPSQGSIKVDGVDLREFKISTWQQLLGIVSQDTFLFNDTIANNIRCGNMSATQEQIEEATRQAYAHDFIMNLPEQYETNVGDRGVKLSGGQRQRLALARALLRKPQILLLDEATSDLDTESERYIQQAIREVSRSCTVIVIAHRLSTIEHADNIIVLEHGRMVEQGQHQELLTKNGRYAEYHRLQFGDKIL